MSGRTTVDQYPLLPAGLLPLHLTCFCFFGKSELCNSPFAPTAKGIHAGFMILNLLGITIWPGNLKIAYRFVILEIQMAVNQGNAVCWKNNGDQDKSRECRKCSAIISEKKEARPIMTGHRIYGDEYMMYSIGINLLFPCIQITYKLRIRLMRTIAVKVSKGSILADPHPVLKGPVTVHC